MLSMPILPRNPGHPPLLTIRSQCIVTPTSCSAPSGYPQSRRALSQPVPHPTAVSPASQPNRSWRRSSGWRPCREPSPRPCPPRRWPSASGPRPPTGSVLTAGLPSLTGPPSTSVSSSANAVQVCSRQGAGPEQDRAGVSRSQVVCLAGGAGAKAVSASLMKWCLCVKPFPP